MTYYFSVKDLKVGITKYWFVVAAHAVISIVIENVNWSCELACVSD